MNSSQVEKPRATEWMMYRIHRVLKDLSKKWAFWDFLLHFSKMLKDPSFLQSKRKKLIWNLINLRTFLFCLFTNDERWKKPNASILGVDAVKLELAHRFPHFCLQFTNGIRNGIRNNFWSNFFSIKNKSKETIRIFKSFWKIQSRLSKPYKCKLKAFWSFCSKIISEIIDLTKLNVSYSQPIAWTNWAEFFLWRLMGGGGCYRLKNFKHLKKYFTKLFSKNCIFCFALNTWAYSTALWDLLM